MSRTGRASSGVSSSRRCRRCASCGRAAPRGAVRSASCACLRLLAAPCLGLTDGRLFVTCLTSALLRRGRSLRISCSGQTTGSPWASPHCLSWYALTGVDQESQRAHSFDSTGSVHRPLASSYDMSLRFDAVLPLLRQRQGCATSERDPNTAPLPSFSHPPARLERCCRCGARSSRMLRSLRSRKLSQNCRR